MQKTIDSLMCSLYLALIASCKQMLEKRPGKSYDKPFCFRFIDKTMRQDIIRVKKVSIEKNIHTGEENLFVVTNDYNHTGKPEQVHASCDKCFYAEERLNMEENIEETDFFDVEFIERIQYELRHAEEGVL